MGHVNNHLATLVCGVFAVVLTGLWPLMVNSVPILNIVFLMAVPIMWFMVFITWVAQKAADYNHVHIHDEKKSSDELSNKELSSYKDDLKENLKEIDSAAEIARLKKEIEHLKTRVEIESIRAEIYNLKMLAAKAK
jgi:5-bromo-4-chloroindolyl phosphate hydrolysis protein